MGVDSSQSVAWHARCTVAGMMLPTCSCHRTRNVCRRIDNNLSGSFCRLVSDLLNEIDMPKENCHAACSSIVRVAALLNVVAVQFTVAAGLAGHSRVRRRCRAR